MSWHRYYPLKLLSPFAFTHFCNLCGQLTQASFALACNLPVFHSAVINSRAFLFFPAPRTSIHLGDRSDFSGPQISSIGCKSGEFAGQSTFLIPWIFRYYSNCLAAFICDDALSSASYTVLLGFAACTCCELTLAWWHVHVSDLFLFPLLFRSCRSCTALLLFFPT